MAGCDNRGRWGALHCVRFPHTAGLTSNGENQWLFSQQLSQQVQPASSTFPPGVVGCSFSLSPHTYILSSYPQFSKPFFCICLDQLLIQQISLLPSGPYCGFSNQAISLPWVVCSYDIHALSESLNMCPTGRSFLSFFRTHDLSILDILTAFCVRCFATL